MPDMQPIRRQAKYRVLCNKLSAAIAHVTAAVATLGCWKVSNIRGHVGVVFGVVWFCCDACGLHIPHSFNTSRIKELEQEDITA
jgi:hypothetical protein